jgi:hypothetical protein
VPTLKNQKDIEQMTHLKVFRNDKPNQNIKDEIYNNNQERNKWKIKNNTKDQ